MNKVTINEQKLEHVTFPKITLCYNRLSPRLSKVFSPSELKEYLSLYEKAQEDPKSALKDVEALQKKHPHLPEIYNLLSYCLILQKKVRRAEKLTLENYEKNPDYLFAKINYADQCLRKKKTSKIPEIFENKMSLTDLYPDRELYHYSELLGYVCVMGFYFLSLGQKGKALDYCAYGKLIDSNDETLILLEKKIYKRTFIESIRSALSPKKAAH